MTTQQPQAGLARRPIRDEGVPAHLGQQTFSDADWQGLKACYGLTPRELDILRHLFDTSHRPQIAKRLGISVHTVDTHLHRAFVKVGVEERGDLILAFVHRVWLENNDAHLRCAEDQARA